MKFDDKNSGQSITCAVGQEFEISLGENPTAGYRWTLVRNGEPVCALIQQNSAPGLGATGQPGTHTWKFQVASAGAATIELAYQRSWESASTPASIFVLHLTGTK